LAVIGSSGGLTLAQDARAPSAGVEAPDVRAHVVLLVALGDPGLTAQLREAVGRDIQTRGYGLVAPGKVDARRNSLAGDPLRDAAAADRLRAAIGAHVAVTVLGAKLEDGAMKVQVSSVTEAGERMERWTGPGHQMVERVAGLVSALIPSAPDRAPAPPVSPAPATLGWDIVVLRDGTTVYGRVLEQTPGSFVVVALPDGRKQTFGWGAIASVSIAPAAAAGPGTVPDAMTADPRNAPYGSTVDCSRSADERCRQQANGQLGQSGLSVSLQGQSVQRRLDSPPSYDLGFALEANFMYGRSTGDDMEITLIGGGWLVGMRGVFGGQLPGEEGGSWSGLGLDATLHVQQGSGSVEAAGQEFDVKQTTTAIGGQIGYQYLHFGPLDPVDLKQSGVGLFFGARVAYQSSETEDGGEGSSGTAYGPVLSLSFPSYNAGTTSMSRWTISAVGLYIENFLLVSTGAGYTW
jgi:hypothetical protein